MVRADKRGGREAFCEGLVRGDFWKKVSTTRVERVGAVFVAALDDGSHGGEVAAGEAAHLQ